MGVLAVKLFLEFLDLEAGAGKVGIDLQGPLQGFEGRRFVERGVLHSALGNFGFIIKLDPDYAEAWHRRASVHYRMGNFTSSIEDIERTLALEPRHFGALAGLGLIYLEIGQERAALKALERALEVNPHLSGTRFKVEELKEKLHGKDTHRLTPSSRTVG